MNVRWIVLGHLRGLLQRWARTLLSVLAVGAGVSLVVGVVIANHSLNKSVAAFAGNVAGDATLRVEGPGDHGGLDESVLPRVQAVPGVASAVPVVVTIAQVVDSRGHELLVPALGVDCGIQALVGSFDCNAELIQSLGDNPVLSPSLQKRLGPEGRIRTDLGELPTGHTLAIDGLNSINGGLVAVFGLEASQRQFVRPNGLEEILVVPAKGADPAAFRAAVTKAAGTNNKVVAADAPLASSIVAGLLLPFLFLISLIGLVIGAQLVRNTLDLSLEERRRDLATSSALGATPRDLLFGLMSEAVVFGLLGAVVGVAGGALVARAFVSSLSNQLERATGLHIATSTPASAAIICIVVSILVSVAASIGPARRAARLDLVAELSERRRFEPDRGPSFVRRAITLSLIAGALALGWIGHADGSVESWQPIVLVVGLAGSAVLGVIACAQFTPQLLAALQRVPGFKTGPTRVALSNLVSAPRRTSAVSIALAAPVFVAVVLGGIVPGMRVAAHGFADASGSDRVYVNTLASNNTSGIDAKVTPDHEAKLLAFPGVARLERSYFVSFSHPTTSMFAVDGIEGPAPDHHVYFGKSGREAFAAGEVMIGPGLARRHHARPGDTLTVPGRYGEAKFAVGGIWASAESLGYSITMRADQLRALVGHRPPDYVMVVPTPGTSATSLAESIRAAHIDDRFRVFDPQQLGASFAKEFEDIASPFRSLQTALLVVALVATASTLALAAAQRRRDNAVLSALGMSPRDLARSTVIETTLIALAATVMGTIAAQATLITFTWSSGVLTGLVIPYRFGAQPVLFAALIAGVVSIVASLIPAVRTARTNVMAALRAA